MAKLNSTLAFTGSLGDLVAYPKKGSDKMIIQTKGGPDKKMFQTRPSMENNRRNCKEFGGVSTTAKHLLNVLHPLKITSDVNLHSAFTSFLQMFQEMDTVSEKGKRNVCITKAPQLLEGFNLNKRNSFDEIVTNPVNCSIYADTQTANFTLPGLVPGRTFHPIDSFPFYCWILVCGYIPDCFYNGEQKYKPAMEANVQPRSYLTTEWKHVNQETISENIQLSFSAVTTTHAASLLAAAGLSFGIMGKKGSIEAVNAAGCGKILRVV